MKTLSQNINDLISSGKTDDALEVLEQKLQQENNQLYQEFLIIKGEHEKTKHLQRTNTLSDDKTQIRINKTNTAILALCESISKKKDGFVSEIITDKAKKNTNKYIIATSIFLLSVALFSYNYFGFQYNTNSSEPEYDLDERVANLVSDKLQFEIFLDYQNVYLNGVGEKKSTVRQETKALMNQLLLIKDEDIELYSKIYKSIGLLISNKILALTTSDVTEQLKYSNKGIEQAKKAESFIAKIANLEDLEYRIELRDWVDSEKHETRILVNKFLVMIANFRAGGIVQKEELVLCYRKLQEDNVLNLEGYMNYPIIKWLFSEEIVKLHNDEK